MPLNWKFVLRNIIPILAAIITVSGVLFVNIYFKPDLWYEEGSYYRSGDRAIASLRIQNYGHGDAEEIRVSVGLPDTILNVTSGEDANPFTVRSGGIGSKAIAGTIHRLVPNESVYLYFAVKNPDGPIPPSYFKFVAPNGIVYKGGIAKEGKPTSWLAWLLTGFSWSIAIVSMAVSYRFVAIQRKQLDEADALLEKASALKARE